MGNLTINSSISRLDSDGVLVNSLNISALGSQAVLTTSDSFFINGPKIFVDGFAAGNLDISGGNSRLALVAGPVNVS